MIQVYSSFYYLIKAPSSSAAGNWPLRMKATGLPLLNRKLPSNSGNTNFIRITLRTTLILPPHIRNLLNTSDSHSLAHLLQVLTSQDANRPVPSRRGSHQDDLTPQIPSPFHSPRDGRSWPIESYVCHRWARGWRRSNDSALSGDVLYAVEYD